MKIVIFAPHPDDEVYGCGGSILKWMEEGHELHIIYVTDNRVLVSWGLQHGQLLENFAKNYLNLTEDQIADICLDEARKVSKAFGFATNNVHLFKFHDQEAKNQIDLGIKLAKEVIVNAHRVVLPSDNNNHTDHQATHIIAKQAALDLGLNKAEFYVYAIYNVIKVPTEKQIKIKITEYREKLYEIMSFYKTQLALKDTRLGWETLKRKRSERFAVFSLDEAGKYYNF
ncbi:MAG: PIG-L deacetylase family protein [Candidatus Thorarchaeota archaeon]